jgi:type II secretory pathway pseudopilin PulG
MLGKKGYTRGDTIIEVLLAITVFSLVGVATITIMNQGVNTTQRALEITLVRQEIDSQVDALQAAHQAYTVLPDAEKADSEWNKIIASGADTSSIDTSNGCPEQSELTGGVFAMNPTGVVLDSSSLKSIVAEDDVPVVYSQRHEDGVYGMWIERERHSAAQPGFPDAYDFRVRACWIAAGVTVSNPMRIETTVRLYDVSQ